MNYTELNHAQILIIDGDVLDGVSLASYTATSPMFLNFAFLEAVV